MLNIKEKSILIYLYNNKVVRIDSLVDYARKFYKAKHYRKEVIEYLEAKGFIQKLEGGSRVITPEGKEAAGIELDAKLTSFVEVK